MKKRKRKKNRGMQQTGGRSAADVIRNIRFLKPEDEFQFECSRCGECCRNVEHSVMLEPYDLFRIARHITHKKRNCSGIEDVIQKYADVKTIGDSVFPVFLLKTRGQRKECVFLEDGRCGIYEARPRACRLYPMGAWPNDAMDGFDYFIATERPSHFKDSAIRAGGWMDQNFSSYDREVTLLDAVATVELARILRDLENNGANRDSLLQMMLLHRYILFETAEPFIPQFMRNIAWLKRRLIGMMEGSAL